MTGLRQNPALESLEIDGDVLLFDGETLHLLRGTAAGIWSLLDGSQDAAQVATEMAGRTPARVEDVDRDVQTFLDELRAAGLVDAATPQTRCEVSAHVAYTNDGDRVVLADLRTGVRQSLSPTGRLVWSLVLDEQLTGTALVEALLERYPEAPDGFLDQVEDLLESLQDQGILQVTTSG